MYNSLMTACYAFFFIYNIYNKFLSHFVYPSSSFSLYLRYIVDRYSILYTSILLMKDLLSDIFCIYFLNGKLLNHTVYPYSGSPHYLRFSIAKRYFRLNIINNSLIKVCLQRIFFILTF